MPSVYAIATMDTKGTELAFVAECLKRTGVDVKMVDVGTKDPPTLRPDIDRQTVVGAAEFPFSEDRGVAISTVSESLVQFMQAEVAAGRVSGVIGIGGSGGTAIVTAAMRQLPIGLPKLMVSTMASGNVAPYVDCSDIAMVHSVVDVAGLNAVSKRVLSNAAHAIAGMIAQPAIGTTNKPTVGMTMFGVTTPCVTAVRESLESRGFDCLVFHATGSGGRAMEKLVDSELIQAVLDITTTEIADEIVGGVLSAGPKRLDALLKKRIPLLLSLGALDMVNFGEIDSVPPEFRSRNLYVHNPQVTLMRTTTDENFRIATWIADKLNCSTTPVSVLIPEKGLSALDAPDQPFHDPDANEALFETLGQQLMQTDDRQLIRIPHHINDPQFAAAIVEQFSRCIQINRHACADDTQPDAAWPFRSV